MFVWRDVPHYALQCARNVACPEGDFEVRGHGKSRSPTGWLGRVAGISGAFVKNVSNNKIQTRGVIVNIANPICAKFFVK